VFRCGSPGSSRLWRGFPIRTPWDHSPVIDSPRLIADSYVLLRLLMPRHPPCALKNLTTKDQSVIFERTMKTNHTQQPPTPKGQQPSRAARSRFIFLEIASYKRCSRPLCSSQTTTPNHTPHTHQSVHDRSGQENQKHKSRDKNPGPVASGPNSVPNTKPPPHPATVPGPQGIRTRRQKHKDSRYLLIFHP
jgi:hypothetical protein